MPINHVNGLCEMSKWSSLISCSGSAEWIITEEIVYIYINIVNIY